MDGIQLPQGWNHFEEAVYFLPLSSHDRMSVFLTRISWKQTSVKVLVESAPQPTIPGGGANELLPWAGFSKVGKK